jgi:hypothetical protein
MMTYSELAELLAAKTAHTQELIARDPRWEAIKGIIIDPRGGVQYLDRESSDRLIKNYPYQWQYIETNNQPVKKITFDAWLSYFNVLPCTTYMIRFYGPWSFRVAVDDFRLEASK